MKSFGSLKTENKVSEVPASLFNRDRAALPKSADDYGYGKNGVGYNFGKIKVHNNEKIFGDPIRVQPKLKINGPDDIYEQEADAMAEKVMRMPDPSMSANKSLHPVTSFVQRKCAKCEEEVKLLFKKEGQGFKLQHTANPVIQKSVQHVKKKIKYIEKNQVILQHKIYHRLWSKPCNQPVNPWIDSPAHLWSKGLALILVR